MLARSRFETETPNVIDIGDDAPTRPTRRSDLPSTQAPPSTTVGNPTGNPFPAGGDAHHQSMYTASNKGHISKGIRISYGIEADEEPDACAPFCDDDDASNEAAAASEDSYSFPRSHPSSVASSVSDEGLYERGSSTKSQPNRVSSVQDNAKSIQEARMFATMMLNESERRAVNLHSERTLSMKQESSSTLRQFMTKATSNRRFYDEISLVEETNIRPHDPKRFRRNMFCRLLAVLVALALTITFIVFAVDGMSPDAAGSLATPEMEGRMDATIAFLFEQEISLAKDLYDESTPQYQAARWVALEDPEQLTVPNSTGQSNGGGLRSSNTFRFVQRYVLAVLYFSFSGDSWDSRHNFVTAAHECAWFHSKVNRDDKTYALGVTCDQHLQVQNLLLRKLVRS